MRILIILTLSGTLGVLGCDSSSSSTGGSGGSAGSGGSGGSAGTGGTAGTGGAGGGTDPAAAFCTDYGTICSFGGAGHQSQQECEDAYNGYDDTRKGCVETHLGLAESSTDTATHCPHATGESPCTATP
jgi:hypothetical protein